VTSAEPLGVSAGGAAARTLEVPMSASGWVQIWSSPTTRLVAKFVALVIELLLDLASSAAVCRRGTRRILGM
jgi:hypothetical protein